MKSNRNQQVSGFVAPAFFAGVVSPTNKGLSTMNEIIHVSTNVNAVLLNKYASRIEGLFSEEDIYLVIGSHPDNNPLSSIYNQIREVANLVETLPISRYRNSDNTHEELGLTPELEQAISNAKQAVSGLGEALRAMSDLITEQAIAICPENYNPHLDCSGASCGYCY